MGKLIPPKSLEETAIQTTIRMEAQPDSLHFKAREISQQMEAAEVTFDLDELDRMARNHARNPATGAAEALEALATVVRFAPDLFIRVDVNLDPGRLEVLADRDRALLVLDKAATRFCDLVKDSLMEQGDEVVELLTVGHQRALSLQPQDERVAGNERLASALRVLSEYHQRVGAEQAHRSAADVKADKTRRKN